MPLVDGIVSTQMIRKHEKELDELKKTRPRVPIIAVSASLIEAKRFDYVQSGYVPFHPIRMDVALTTLGSMLGY